MNSRNEVKREDSLNLLGKTLRAVVAGADRKPGDVLSVAVEWADVWNDDVRDHDLGIPRMLAPKVVVTFSP